MARKNKATKARRSKADNRREYGSTPKLTCILTGQTRSTNMDYLQAKADRLGVSVEDICKNYVSREGLRLLKSGKTPKEIMESFDLKGKPVAERRAKELIRFNSKTAAEKEEAVAA